MKINLSSVPLYYINLDRDVNRNKSIIDSMIRIGHTNFNRISAELVSEAEIMQGPGRSHLKAITTAEHSGIPFIILEDDVRDINYRDIINVPDDADAVYLGIMLGHRDPMATPVDGYPGVYRVKEPLGCHAIMYTSDRYLSVIKDICTTVGNGTDSGPGNLHTALGFAFLRVIRNYNVYAINPVFYQHDESNPAQSNATRVINIAKKKIDPISYQLPPR